MLQAGKGRPIGLQDNGNMYVLKRTSHVCYFKKTKNKLHIQEAIYHPIATPCTLQLHVYIHVYCTTHTIYMYMSYCTSAGTCLDQFCSH